MKPGEWNTKIFRNSIWEFTFTWKNEDGTPHNLSGFSARMEFSERGAGFINPTTKTASPALDATGAIHIKMEETETNNIPWDEGNLRLMLIEPDTDVYPILVGSVKVR